MAAAGNITPDAQNPIQMSEPINSANGQQIIFRFTLPTTINYKQFIGVTFPTTIGTSDLSFDQSGRFGCALTDGTNTYTVTPVQSTQAENYIAYCRLDDMTNSQLKAGTSFKLTITLTATRFTSNYVRTVGLFTSTSATADRVVIDSIPVIGTIATYGAYTSMSSRPLDITSSVVTPTSGPNGSTGSGSVFPSNTFDITLNLKVNNFISAVDHYIVFRYSTTHVATAASSVTSNPISATSTDTKQMALKATTTLGLQSFGTHGLLLTNVGEDLIPNRTFQIVLKGWKAAAVPAYSASSTLSTGNLEIVVFYKNTYSIYSYVANSIFTIAKTTLAVTAAHPDGWDLFRHGAWPIKFTITPNNDVSNGGFVVIQHSNLVAASNRFNFVASTCDFSDNTSSSALDNAFAKRSACYALRTDMLASSSTGSGIIFNVKGLSSGTAYYVTVWGFADNCGGSTYDPLSATSPSVSISFTVSIYNTIDVTKQHDNRLTWSSTGPAVIAQTSSSPSVKCWNSKIQGGESGGKIFEFTETTVAALTTATDIIHFREISDWGIENSTSSGACNSGATCFGTDVTSGSFTEAFLYSSASSTQISTTSSYFFAHVISATGSTTAPRNSIPMPIVGAIATPTFTSGKLVALFSKNWFTTGDPISPSGSATIGCYLAWAVKATGVTTAQKVMFHANTANPASDGNKLAVTTGTSSTASTLDANASSNSGTFKLVSTAYTSGGTNYFKYMADATAAVTSAIDLYYYTNCLKWNLPTVKSIYSYIDVQFQWQTTGGVPTRNLRLIKLYPEAGVFNNYAKDGQPSTTIENPTTFHYAYGTDTSSGSSNGVCLIQLGATAFSTNADTGSSAMAFFIQFGILLESDYNDVAAIYPAVPLGSGVSAWGLQSNVPMTSDNSYLGNYDSATTTVYTLATWQGSTGMFGTGAVARSTYHQYMGSLLLLTGINNALVTVSSGTNVSLLVPFYCPQYNAAYPPTAVTQIWLGMTSHASIGTVNKILAYYPSTSAGIIVATKINYLMPATAKGTPAAGTAAPLSLRFTIYGSTTTETLYVYNGTSATAGAATNCTGFSLFMSSLITLSTSTTITPSISSTASGTFNASKNVYAFGKVFNKAYLFVAASTALTATTTADFSSTSTAPASSVSFTGINKPLVDAFYASASASGTNVGTTLDHIGMFCASSGTAAADNMLASNLIGNSASATGVFILDWNPVTSSLSWASGNSITADKTEVVYKNDSAGNVKISLTIPASIPKYSVLSLGANNSAFTGATACGIVASATASTSIVTECTNNGSGSMSCTIPSTGTAYTICCYTVVIPDTFSLSSLSVTFPTSPTNSAVTSGTILSTTLSSTTYSTGASSSTTDILASTSNAKITAFSYSNINQDTGIGKAVLTVTLPREMTRNMKLTVSGDFTGLAIPNALPRCVVTTGSAFGQTWDSGDTFIDTCSTANFSSTANNIIITTKNLVYKCGLTSQKVMTIYLWPVQTFIWTSTSTTTYKVTMAVNSSSNDMVNNGQAGIAMPTAGFNNVSAKPVSVGQWETLCAPTVVPRIPGAYADYTFNFDLDTAKTVLTGTNPNELSIFFPYQHYGATMANIVCYYKSALINCSFTEEGMLSVRFSSNLPIGSGSKVPITVTGIINPGTDSDLYFPCSVNNNSYITGSLRTNLVTGSGKLTGGITYGTAAPNGNLRFLTPGTALSDANPRNTSQHILRVAIDSGVGQPSLPLTINNTPVLYITLPSDYTLAWYTTSKVTVSIDEYTSDTNNAITVTSTITPTVSQSGNRITATFNVTSYTLISNFRYWDIKINGVVAPNNPTSQASGLFDVILTNSDYTAVYRTFTNLNSNSGVALTTSIDNNLFYNRGYQFTYDNTKWVININAAAPLNTLTVKTGRFLTTSFNVGTNTSITIQPAVTIVSLPTDNNFKTSLASYSVSSSVYQPISFMIGVTCGTIPGAYVINFTSSNSSGFAPIPPIPVTVDHSAAGTISYQTNNLIAPLGGSMWLGILLSEPNVDALSVKWTASSTARNDATATLSTVTLPMASITSNTMSTANPISPYYSVFSITNTTATSAQQFTSTDPNTCYKWSSNSVSINLSGSLATLPATTDLSKSFVYSSAATDTTMTVKNTIRFTFTPPVAPLYVYCALSCTNVTMPSDTAMVGLSQIGNTALLQYYANIANSVTPLDMIYSGLVRGQTYQMKCLLTTTHGDSTLRSSLSYSLTNGTYSNSTAGPIQPPSPLPTQCVQYLFNSEPGNATRIALVNYCQRAFSSSGYNANGCIICTDSNMSYNAPGLTLPYNMTCLFSNATRTSLRFLQTTNTTNTTTTNTTTTPTANVTYSVCPVPHPICTNDVNAGSRSYSDVVTTLSGLNTAQLIAAAIGTTNTPINTTTIFSDANAPNITGLSVTNINANANGLASWTATTLRTVSPMTCRWQIQQSGSTQPTATSMLSCTSAWCGTAKANSIGVAVSTGSNLSAFTAGASYNIWYLCYNDLPFPQKAANVTSVGTFNIPAVNNPPTNVTGSSFISFSMLAMLMLFALIFN